MPKPQPTASATSTVHTVGYTNFHASNAVGHTPTSTPRVMLSATASPTSTSSRRAHRLRTLFDTPMATQTPTHPGTPPTVQPGNDQSSSISSHTISKHSLARYQRGWKWTGDWATDNSSPLRRAIQHYHAHIQDKHWHVFTLAFTLLVIPARISACIPSTPLQTHDQLFARQSTATASSQTGTSGSASPTSWQT